MRKKTIAKWILGLFIVSMVLQAGAAVYALVASTTTSSTEEQPLSETMWSQPIAADVEISQEVMDKIKSSDPTYYEQNVANYKKLLSVLDVHPKFRSEMERLIAANHRLSDILVAYEYLYHSFGMAKDVESFVLQKESGQSWESIFETYKKAHASFVPQAFDSDELEQLMRTSGITADDIMLADRIAFESGKPFKELVNMRLQNQGQSWKEINAQLNLVYSASVLPRVKVTSDEVQKYTQTGKLTQDQVAEAFVLAYKLGQQPQGIIDQYSNGLREETIFAETLSNKYGQ
ncbi:hypothetical protein ACFQ88_10725 [Paenibacillus sp. NPDC056579]|uniref:hypothetical protein n=1 Tax=Paenibacillus sp. NPDC056579 TaxID=3345871 RepID=UPI0036AC7163